jgi:hypothetical protein
VAFVTVGAALRFKKWCWKKLVEMYEYFEDVIFPVIEPVWDLTVAIVMGIINLIKVIIKLLMTLITKLIKLYKDYRRKRREKKEAEERRLTDGREGRRAARLGAADVWKSSNEHAQEVQ